MKKVPWYLWLPTAVVCAPALTLMAGLMGLLMAVTYPLRRYAQRINHAPADTRN